MSSKTVAIALALDKALLHTQVEQWQRTFRNYFLLLEGDMKLPSIELLTSSLQAADNLMSPFTVRSAIWYPLKQGVMFRITADGDRVVLSLRYQDRTPDWEFAVYRDARTLARYLEVATK